MSESDAVHRIGQRRKKIVKRHTGRQSIYSLKLLASLTCLLTFHPRSLPMRFLLWAPHWLALHFFVKKISSCFQWLKLVCDPCKLRVSPPSGYKRSNDWCQFRQFHLSLHFLHVRYIFSVDITRFCCLACLYLICRFIGIIVGGCVSSQRVDASESLKVSRSVFKMYLSIISHCHLHKTIYSVKF